ncbi:MAG: DUF2628 domain-containing protein [Rhodospirillales bacterium]
MRLYTVHLNRAGAVKDGSLVLVKEGFCWPAFFLSFVWALWHRMWLAAIGLIAVQVALGSMAAALGLDASSQGVVSLGLAVAVGFVANDLRRWTLERSGYALKGVIGGDGLPDAERRFLKSEPGLAAELL